MTSTANQAISTIDAQTLKTLIDRDLVTLVDVREPAEFSGDRIQGSTLAPLSTFNPDKVVAELGKELVVMCQPGNRSGQAARALVAAGHPQVTHLEGGLNAWKQSGLSTLTRKDAPISIMRQVQIVAGSLMMVGTVLGASVSPWFLLLSGFVGAGLMFSGLSGTCMMATLLAKLPYNQPM